MRRRRRSEEKEVCVRCEEGDKKIVTSSQEVAIEL